MTDNPTRTAVQTSVVDSWWDDAEAGECLPDDGGSGEAIPEVVEDRYSETLELKASPYSLGEFYKTTVTTFWDRDVLGARAFGRDAIGAVWGESVARSADQTLDAAIRHPGDVIVSASESLLPGSGEYVAEVEEAAMTATDALITGAMGFFDAAEIPSLGDYYAKSVTAPALSFALESEASEAFGFHSETWNSTYLRSFSYPYSFHSELSMADSLRQTGSVAPPIEATRQPVASTLRAAEVKKTTAPVPVTVVAARPRRSNDSYSAPAVFESPYAVSTSMRPVAPVETIEYPVLPPPKSGTARIASAESASIGERWMANHTSPDVPDEQPSVAPPRTREVTSQVSSSIHSVTVDDSSFRSLEVSFVQGAGFLPAPNVGFQVQEFESGVELTAINPDAVPSNTWAVPIYAAEIESGPVAFAVAREVKVLGAPAVSESLTRLDLAAKTGTSDTTFPIAAKRKSPSIVSDRDDSESLVSVMGFVFGMERSILSDARSPMFARESERFINAAAWFLPRKFAERVSERDCATEQADVVEGLNRRHESVANLDDMGADRDGSQHKPDWSQLLREHAASSRLKTFRPESAEEGDFGGDDSAFRPARDAYVM